MTELEYVQSLRMAARDYLSHIRLPDDGMKMACDRWWTVKGNLSAHTFVDLCDAWLERQRINPEGVRR
jgi:uncharacterized membrane protein YcgQ (UPF0703/DUF1980 family)